MTKRKYQYIAFSAMLIILIATMTSVGGYTLNGFSLSGESRQGVLSKPISAPEFTHTTAEEWINSEPLTLNDLKGKVVLIDFWTFGCWNCYRSFPWLNALEKRLGDAGLQVIGVHTPEFDHEREIDNVRKKVKEFKLHHPVMIDNDFSYWRAMKNRYWPAFYVLDKEGKIRGTFIGETHEGDRRAKTIENLIKRLLAA